MSLDVYLNIDEEVTLSDDTQERIFIREDGRTKEITREEWNRRFPDREPVIVPDYISTEVYWANITHNLVKMADKAGIYAYLWRPDEWDITHAKQLIEPLTLGLSNLHAQPEYFKQFNPENGWGTYEGLVDFVEEYLDACKKYPDAKVSVWI